MSVPSRIPVPLIVKIKWGILSIIVLLLIVVYVLSRNHDKDTVLDHTSSDTSSVIQDIRDNVIVAKEKREQLDRLTDAVREPIYENSIIMNPDYKDIMCPRYIMPTMPKLPRLPPKDVLDSLSPQQLNYVLYQHIKAHQDRTIEVRRLLYDNYVAYLKTCE